MGEYICIKNFVELQKYGIDLRIFNIGDIVSIKFNDNDAIQVKHGIYNYVYNVEDRLMDHFQDLISYNRDKTLNCIING